MCRVTVQNNPKYAVLSAGQRVIRFVGSDLLPPAPKGLKKGRFYQQGTLTVGVPDSYHRGHAVMNNSTTSCGIMVRNALGATPVRLSSVGCAVGFPTGLPRSSRAVLDLYTNSNVPSEVDGFVTLGSPWNHCQIVSTTGLRCVVGAGSRVIIHTPGFCIHWLSEVERGVRCSSPRESSCAKKIVLSVGTLRVVIPRARHHPSIPRGRDVGPGIVPKTGSVKTGLQRACYRSISVWLHGTYEKLRYSATNSNVPGRSYRIGALVIRLIVLCALTSETSPLDVLVRLLIPRPYHGLLSERCDAWLDVYTAFEITSCAIGEPQCVSCPCHCEPRTLLDLPLSSPLPPGFSWFNCQRSAPIAYIFIAHRSLLCIWLAHLSPVVWGSEASLYVGVAVVVPNDKDSGLAVRAHVCVVLLGRYCNGHRYSYPPSQSDYPRGRCLAYRLEVATGHTRREATLPKTTACLASPGRYTPGVQSHTQATDGTFERCKGTVLRDILHYTGLPPTQGVTLSGDQWSAVCNRTPRRGGCRPLKRCTVGFDVWVPPPPSDLPSRDQTSHLLSYLTVSSLVEPTPLIGYDWVHLWRDVMTLLFSLDRITLHTSSQCMSETGLLSTTRKAWGVIRSPSECFNSVNCARIQSYNKVAPGEAGTERNLLGFTKRISLSVVCWCSHFTERRSSISITPSFHLRMGGGSYMLNSILCHPQYDACIL
ncbi:hypothetical protein GOBAR_AA28545 [Gossypium barbadense]|uniref:Uncharacterized protein n=1 Tax=Gossypium barbadense TaxID=3634 RepID=A0A2P5WM10_GOSBA|nr:hypothetical protein GOBAR_AA28545 [Gossypium barbadense]